MFRRRGSTMHDTDEPTMVERPAEPVVSPIDGMAQSMLFTLLGAAALIVSAFLEWIRPDGIVGADLSYRVLFDADFGTDATFARSAGAVVIGIGLLAILGMATRAGWVTRLAGALGIIAFATFTITLYRVGADLPNSLGVGAWVLLGGGLLTMFGGLFATRPKIVVRKAAPAP
ncbi:MAG TPA: sugar:proton symporter [Actinomycetota bacterium]|nr:sugar:proton symporter [Actinomycetota bacterium]